MFGRKKKKQEEPKSYLRCPYCGRKPVLRESVSEESFHAIFQMECRRSCLRTGWLRSPDEALKFWVQMVSGYYDAEIAIRQFCEQKKDE